MTISQGVFAPARLKLMACPAFCLLSLFASPLQARDYFNPAFLDGSNALQAQADLSAFENEGSQTPGNYHVDLYVNKQFAGTYDLDFFLQQDVAKGPHLQPCLDIGMLGSLGVKTDAFPALQNSVQGCANLAAIPQASAEFDFSQQRLMLSIPLAAMNSQARGFVAPERWDQGISALLLNYSYSGATTWDRHGKTNDSNYVNLRPGLNLGAWRLRNYTTWSNSNGNSGKWQSAYTYLQRDIAALRSQLVLGDSSTTADVFDSVPFRGAQLSSDDQMRPDSLRGYAPIIRGVARTNAQVTITQNGYTVYQSYVPPGEFAIDDLYPSSSGELKVTIKEADGSEQVSLVPYASVAVMQREGQFKYEATSGNYRTYNSNIESTPFSQASLIYGLPWDMTLYGGLQTASKYQSLLMGIGKNLGDFGALSTDITQSWASLQDQQKSSGQSLRLRYNKNLLATGTNFAVAGYRYSTAGFYTLGETLSSYRKDNNSTLPERRRNRTELMVNQNLGKSLGYLSVSLINEDYWNSERTTTSANLSYGNSWNSISYSLSYSLNRNTNDNDSGRSYNNDNLFSLSVSVPLNKWLGGSWASYRTSVGDRHRATHSLGLNGSALADNNLNWSLQQSLGSDGASNSSDASLSYRGSYGQMGAGYGYSSNGRRLNYNLQGGMLAHANGMTLSQPLGETVALIAAPKASGVRVSNQTGVATDFRGYTVVPYLTPYRENTLRLRPDTLPDDVELELNSQTLVPTRGAVVRASFTPAVGKRLLMTLMRPQGQPVPFGAMVSAADAKTTKGSIVGDNGEVFLAGMDPRGKLQVQWGKQPGQQCQVDYQLSEQDPSTGGIVQLTQQCI
ncbi:fimbria/pilus outer membrane usher protein [Serratia proteamaculans]|uniref:Fimbria/pilus outer membrane usher protein n=1 Tax=Serratia proteamaculans TaxID=28151 RepID=A0A5Q2V930_SERPR|nr:fimbria/pilus outer membrane usher protein [Serratia proteamaculans]QGH61987.1 fimbria/pilus outer membrane usher protein [Serratia proteamaculans]